MKNRMLSQLWMLMVLLAATNVLYAQQKSESNKPVQKSIVKIESSPSSSSVLAIRKVSAKEVKGIMDTSSIPLIVNFWATWCGPCVHELAYFDSIITAQNAHVKLLLVSLDFPESYPKRLTSFVKKKGYKGEVVWLNESVADSFIPVIEPKWNGAIPASIFIDNSKKYYKVFNSQLTKNRFALELAELTRLISDSTEGGSK